MLEETTAYIKKKMQERLEIQKHKDTGKLIDTIKVVYENGYIIAYIEDYGIYVNWGRRPGGKMPPISVLENWVRRKNFVLKDGQNYRSLAFAIAQSIKKKGIPAKPYKVWKEGNTIKRVGWIDDVIKEDLPEAVKIMSKELRREIETIIEKSLFKYDKDKQILIRV